MNELVRFALTTYYPRVDDLPGLAELGVDEKIQRLRRESTLLFWTGIVAASVAFQLAPLLTLRKPLLASWLSPEDLDQHAHKMASHPAYLVRQVTFLIKLVGGLFWGQSPEIRAFLDLTPYPADPGTRRLETFVPRQGPLPGGSPEKLLSLGKKERERGRDKDRGKGLQA
ncbi:hypothetical protein [Polyangium sp. y55x31]|uniref:hypothetical protein n=1 Tax=Polyangium sp. y55x31 TaxID=3042688 RepID=UPI002482F67E|nr:hypothetical protein [Polyangium sp. y55x31]MDI1483463.1 hypothetical protein [Polyangium sp. y55x31]